MNQIVLGGRMMEKHMRRGESASRKVGGRGVCPQGACVQPFSPAGERGASAFVNGTLNMQRGGGEAL